MWSLFYWAGLVSGGIDRGDLTLNAAESVHTSIHVPYVLDLDHCEIVVEPVDGETPLECLEVPVSCPSMSWFRLDDHYYPISGQVWIYEGAIVADGLEVTNCRRAGSGDDIPITAYSLLVNGTLISLNYDAAGALAYTVTDNGAVVGARTRHGDAICDGEIEGPSDPPALPWDDLIMRSPYELEKLK